MHSHTSDVMIKILVADDDNDILELLEYNLSKEGYEVLLASNGKEAIEIAQKEIPDLIILDVMMPEFDGVEVCEKLRSQRKFLNTLIIFLTARSEDFTQIACYENGGDDYIVKPIKPRVLMSRIKAILRRQIVHTSNYQSTEVAIGDIRIDIEQHQVIRGDEHITLPKKEFELLTLLISRPGKLFSRDEIFNKVWGVETVIGDRTIDVHIRKLREKIGNDFIKTVKGVGYKIEVPNS